MKYNKANLATNKQDFAKIHIFTKKNQQIELIKRITFSI